MSNHRDHERIRDSSSETNSEGPVYCCHICQLEADGGIRTTGPSSVTEPPSYSSTRTTNTKLIQNTQEMTMTLNRKNTND